MNFVEFKKNTFAMAALLCMLSEASAFNFGSAHTSSRRGEPLKSEIELINLTNEELRGLKVGLGTSSLYRAANIEVPRSNGEPLDVSVELITTDEGKRLLQVTSKKIVTSDYVDVLVEVTWSTGRTLKGVGLTIESDEPSQFIATPLSPITSDEEKVMVRKGDTASELAMRHLKKEISLDQMLVALLTKNPHAFINNNVNLIKADSELDLPDDQQVSQVSQQEARQLIRKQNISFKAYKAQLAQMASTLKIPKASNEATGKLNASITPIKKGEHKDALTLSTPINSTGESTIALDHQAREMAKQAEEINKNISELKKITQNATNASNESQWGFTSLLPSTTTEKSEKIRNLLLIALTLSTGWMLAKFFTKTKKPAESKSINET